jgi:hypothetical protein
MRRKRKGYWDDLTISEPLSTTLGDGTVIEGVLWMHVSDSVLIPSVLS